MYVYQTAAMDPYDSAEEEAQWILAIMQKAISKMSQLIMKS